MQNFIVGKQYTFKDEDSKRRFIDSHSINAKLTANLGEGNDIFTVVAGRTRYQEKGSVTSVVGTTVENAETISVNGQPICTGSQVTAIANSEMRYFMEYVSTEVRMEEDFKNTKLCAVIELFKQYNPTAPDSKITLSALRKCWIQHQLNIKKEEQKLAIEEAKIVEMKAKIVGMKAQLK
ncbi:hypothetical protein Aeh1ORF278c [Aeromonas phage Aeh1]|uniref:Uncharacterized protein n=1 Tax=Aeromonas phage Aeh1 TaxID=2880362 RepID=Q76YF2_9CAUD|nr:hypothetical protein Aeh1p293 [Aeromonas phage Aeh1]AAQ17943.1 hypothetical protein Aeh1ORF278c [Aeromonas phage Aeh1]